MAVKREQAVCVDHHQHLATAIEAMPVPVLVTDADTRQVRAANRLAAELFAATRGQLLAATIADLTHDSHRPGIDANYQQGRTPTGATTLKRYVRFDGSDFIGHLKATVHHTNPDLFVAVITSVEETDALRNDLVAAASIDDLTGALRRSAFLDSARLFASMHAFYGVLFIDVDRLKPINDNLGHDAGDAVLVTVAQRTRESFRQGDLLGRFGGDEFVVFVSDLANADKLERLTSALHRRICQPLTHNATTINTSVSIGATLNPGTTRVEHAINSADQIMLTQKHAKQRARTECAYQAPARATANREL